MIQQTCAAQKKRRRLYAPAAAAASLVVPLFVPQPTLVFATTNIIIHTRSNSSTETTRLKVSVFSERSLDIHTYIRAGLAVEHICGTRESRKPTHYLLLRTKFLFVAREKTKTLNEDRAERPQEKTETKRNGGGRVGLTGQTP